LVWRSRRNSRHGTSCADHLGKRPSLAGGVKGERVKCGKGLQNFKGLREIVAEFTAKWLPPLEKTGRKKSAGSEGRVD